MPPFEKCFWERCSNSLRCRAHGSCIAKAQAGGASFTLKPIGSPGSPARAKQDMDDLRSVVTAYLDHLQKSINVGPLTKQPTKEAALLRRMQELIYAPDPPADLSDGLPHLNRNE